jgi:hypothetical protein
VYGDDGEVLGGEWLSTEADDTHYSHGEYADNEVTADEGDGNSGEGVTVPPSDTLADIRNNSKLIKLKFGRFSLCGKILSPGNTPLAALASTKKFIEGAATSIRRKISHCRARPTRSL